MLARMAVLFWYRYIDGRERILAMLALSSCRGGGSAIRRQVFGQGRGAIGCGRRRRFPARRVDRVPGFGHRKNGQISLNVVMGGYRRSGRLRWTPDAISGRRQFHIAPLTWRLRLLDRDVRLQAGDGGHVNQCFQ